MMQIALLGVLVGSIFLNAVRFKSMWLIFAVAPVLLSMASVYLANVQEDGEERGVSSQQWSGDRGGGWWD